jgi:NAD(P)H-nitrite reductase large subunit
LTQLRAHLAAGRKPEEFELPQENTHPAILLRELLQKMTGGWKFPLAQEELCHCRSIPTHVVDQAIIAGAHDVNTVRRWTSANTACGTCLPEVQTLLDFRLKK